MIQFQAGEPDVVLEAGEKALLVKDAKPFKRDILLSMALAQCSLAAQAFDTKDEVCLHASMCFLGCIHVVHFKMNSMQANSISMCLRKCFILFLPMKFGSTGLMKSL